MVIWINGAYGSGKSMVASELHNMIDNAFLYNPENAGDFIRSNIPDSMWKDDFQDYPLWRDITYNMISILALENRYTIIVPMTVSKRIVFDEVIMKLMNASVEIKHFVLQASRETLMQRLLNRGESPGSWCMNQIDNCISIFENEITDVSIDTENKVAFNVAIEIKKQINL